jgi:hypothetical protein
MTEISFSVQVIPDTFEEFQTDSTASATNFLQHIIQTRGLKDPSGQKIDLSKYKVLVAYQLLSPEVKTGQLLPEEKIEITEESSFSEAGVRSGYHILFVKPPTVSSKLKLEIGGRIITVEDPIYKVGRTDPDKNIYPDLNLAEYMGDRAQRISRQLFSFIEEQGKWSIQLNKKANTVVYLDGKQLSRGKYELLEKSLISIGGSQGSAYQEIIVTLVNE